MSDAANLRQTAYKGVKWVAISTYSIQVIRFFTLMILAAVIAKEEFGVLGVATLVIIIAQNFTEFGTGQALIWYRGQHTEEHQRDAIDTGFYIVCFTNFIVVLALNIAAPHIAAFFDAPRAEKVIRVLNISMVFAVLTIAPRSMLEKRLAFRQLFIPEVIPSLASAFVSIPMAIFYPKTGVWALVAGQITNSVLRFILFSWAARWRPRLNFKPEIARSLLSYSVPLLGAAVMNSALSVGAPGMVGKLLGTVALGVYNLADRIAAFPFHAIIFVVGRVMFPLYSKIRDDAAALRHGCADAIKLITLASAPVCIGLAAIIPCAELVVFRGKWWDLPLPLAFMMLRTLQRAVGSIAGDIYKATGKPSMLQIFFTVRFLLEMIFVTSGALLWGLAGAGLGELIASSFALLLELWALNRRIGLTWGMVADAVKVPICAACLAAATASICLWPGVFGPTLIGLAVGVSAGAVVYLAIIAALERPVIRDLRSALWGGGGSAAPAAAVAEPLG